MQSERRELCSALPLTFPHQDYGSYSVFILYALSSSHLPVSLAKQGWILTSLQSRLFRGHV
jgi:hypothetical protein